MAFTKNFLFTDPVAAQQAVQYAQLASQDQAAQAQAFNDRMRIGTGGRIAQQNAQQQQMMNQYQMQQRAAENEKDRELDRELARQGYTNAQTVATIASGGRVNPVDVRLKAQQDADAAANKAFSLENFNRGTSFAMTLNDPKTPLSLKQKLMQSGDVEMGPDGLWRSRHKNPNESINDIMNRRAGMGPSTISVTPMPSPGPRVPSPTDFKIPYPGTFNPPAPVEPSPFETPGFKVFRQSDFAPHLAPGFKVFRQSDFAPVPFTPFTPPPVAVPFEAPVDQPWMQPGY